MLNMDMESLEKTLQQEIAAKVIANLPEEQRRAIIAEGIVKVLRNIEIKWEIKDLLLKEALITADEYIKQPEVQEKLRQKVREAVDQIIDGIWKAIVKLIESGIKSKYVRLSDITFDED